MDTEGAFRLSFYQDVSAFDEKRRITLVKNISNGRLFIKSVLSDYDRSVYETLAAGDFPGVAKVFECVEDRDAHTLTVISEYVSGQTLGARIDRIGAFTPEETVRIASQLCDALAPLHKLDPPIIHRDIKPSNVILRDDGNVCLIDFDASKVFDANKMRDTQLIGTEGYAAPEQYGFSQSDPRTDIYALGKLIEAMITGDVSPTGRCAVPDQLPLAKVIRKCTAMDPAARYKNVKALKKDLYYALHPGRKLGDSSWMIPGYRTKKPWKMILATVTYIVLILIPVLFRKEDAFNLETTISYYIAIPLIIFLTFNYRGIHQKLPLMNSRYFLVKAFGWYIYVMLIEVIAYLAASSILDAVRYFLP